MGCSLRAEAPTLSSQPAIPTPAPPRYYPHAFLSLLQPKFLRTQRTSESLGLRDAAAAEPAQGEGELSGHRGRGNAQGLGDSSPIPVLVILAGIPNSMKLKLTLTLASPNLTLSTTYIELNFHFPGEKWGGEIV